MQTHSSRTVHQALATGQRGPNVVATFWMRFEADCEPPTHSFPDHLLRPDRYGNVEPSEGSEFNPVPNSYGAVL